MRFTFAVVLLNRVLLQQKVPILLKLYVPADTDFIQTLCRVYEDVTGNEAVLSAIGGGTYARAFQNCVCFGAVYPGETLTVHSPNERTAKVNILLNTCMYGKAIYELTKQ